MMLAGATAIASAFAFGASLLGSSQPGAVAQGFHSYGSAWKRSKGGGDPGQRPKRGARRHAKLAAKQRRARNRP